jgi:membrane protein YqaA with SNARE-associated domain
LSHLRILLSTLGHFFSHYGGWGLFAISFLDSSFLYFPVINDLLLIKLSSTHPEKAALYALQCTAGSVLGAYLIYFATRHGSRLLSRKTPPREKTRIRHWIERNDFLSILVAALLPPPAPFKVFAIIAGGLRMDALRFIVALLIGRGARFGFEGWLGVRYGVAAQNYLKKNLGWICLLVIVVIVIIAAVSRRVKSSPSPRV